MYQSCIYCSADMGANQALESFPIGRTVAFDAGKGRLWAVCGKCGRWNLAPIEERWEPVEDAERLFRDCRTRVQAENVGLAKLRDGTRLIRVGAALQGELAAWRYGSTLEQRRKKYVVATGAVALGVTAVFGGLVWAGIGGLFTHTILAWHGQLTQRELHRAPAEASPDGKPRIIRRWHVEGARLGEDASGDIALRIPGIGHVAPKSMFSSDSRDDERDVLVLSGQHARRALERSMVRVNAKGGKRRQLADAVALIKANSPEEYIRQAARGGWYLGKVPGKEDQRLKTVGALALEMALHEEQERRALQGELSILQAAWRDAEQIADIADRLAIAPTQTE
ncbi:MAG TPA: hypothetical protein VF584_06475 [Longimicrobium sp.]|jgi:hypothetical protein